jgi:hypothetical protein
MRSPLIVSHYTRNTGYEKEIQNLISSLKTLELPYSITAIDSLGTWRANSNYCAENVQVALRDNPERDILRVDADAVFYHQPRIPPCDIAAHIHDFRWHENELLGGTLFFKNNERVRTLVDAWVVLACDLRKTERNGDLLQELISKNPCINFYDLPAEYCKIFDKMPEVTDPIIEHFQASRRFKREVNRNGQR